MDARKSRIINEAHDYMLENWIYTEPFIQKITNELDEISEQDQDVSGKDKEKLAELNNILSHIDRDRPGLEITWPSFLSKENQTSNIEMPLEMQKEIFSKLSFSERHRLATVSSAWNAFFNEQVIEKEFLFPKKSGGLVFFSKDKQPNILRELLSKMENDTREDIQTELCNSLSFKNNKKIEELEKSKSDGISAYYALWIPLGIAVLLSYYYDSNKLFYGAMSIFLLPLIVDPFHRREVKRLASEPAEARESIENYFGRFKK